MAIMDVDIDATVIGETKVMVDGQDVSEQVTRVVVDIGTDREHLVPKIFLEGSGRGVIKVNGQVIEHTDQTQAVVEWLLTVDPAKLEREALDSLGLDFDGPQTTGEAILAKLVAWASGHDDGTGPSSG